MRPTTSPIAQIPGTLVDIRSLTSMPFLVSVSYTHLDVYKRQVLGRLEHYLKPQPDTLADPQTFAFCVRVTLYAMAFGIKEVGEHDPEVRPIALDLPDGTVEMRVDNGPAAHLTVKGGKFEPRRGPAEKPNAILEFADLHTAWDTFQGNLDTFAAVGGGKMKLRGFIPLLEGINPLMDRLAYYLSD